MKKKKFYIFGLMVIFFGVLYFSFKNIDTSVQTNVNYQKDSDYDGLTDKSEKDLYHTDPLKADTDGDGFLDSSEILIKSDPLNSLDPGANTNISAVVDNSISIPWFITRTAGIVAYILMFLIVMLGAGMTTSYIYRYINPVKAWLIHKYLSLAMGIVLLTHVVALIFDKFINFSLQDIFIPFHSNYKSLFLSLGILGFYILLIIIFSSLWFRLRYKKAWRFIHYFVYALFIFSLVHGLFIGTDSSTLTMRIIYYFTGFIFLDLLIYRFIIYLFKTK